MRTPRNNEAEIVYAGDAVIKKKTGLPPQRTR
jgi:hypothetical protein